MPIGHFTKPGTMTTHETPSGKITKVKDSGKLPFDESIVARRPKEDIEVNRIAKGGFGEAARDVDNRVANEAAREERWNNMSQDERGAILGAIKRRQRDKAERTPIFDLKNSGDLNAAEQKKLAQWNEQEKAAAAMLEDRAQFDAMLNDIIADYIETPDSNDDAEIATVRTINRLIKRYNDMIPGTQRDMIMIPNELLERVASQGSKARRVSKHQLRADKGKKAADKEELDANIDTQYSALSEGLEGSKIRAQLLEAKAHDIANKARDTVAQHDKDRQARLASAVSANLPGAQPPSAREIRKAMGPVEEQVFNAYQAGELDDDQYATLKRMYGGG